MLNCQTVYRKKCKLCSVCGEMKPLEYFWKDKTASSGYYAMCIKCANERKKELRETRQGNGACNETNAQRALMF